MRATPVRLLELPDVVHHHLGVVHLGCRRLDVGSVDALDVLLVEDRLHRLDRRQRLLQLFQQRHFQHARLDRGFVGVVFENVPAADLQVVQAGQRHEILDRRAAAFGALSQPDGSQLGQRTDRFPESALDGFQPGDEGRRDRAHAGNQDPQFALGGRNLDVVCDWATTVLL